jgi:hypothetical protein
MVTKIRREGIEPARVHRIGNEVENMEAVQGELRP